MVVLDIPGIDPTSNAAERAHRFGVLWRKRTQGTRSEMGNRLVERVLSFRQTCRLRGRPKFSLLVEAVRCRFQGQTPILRCMAHQEPRWRVRPRHQRNRELANEN